MSKITITAEPSEIPDICSFTVSEPVFPNDSLVCSNRVDSYGSPLLEALFQIEGVVEVAITHNLLTIKKDSAREWKSLAKDIGVVVRTVLEGGAPLFREGVKEHLKEEKKVAKNPNRSKFKDPESIAVFDLIEEKINPAIAAHGGHIELLRVEDHVAYITMSGGCQGCGMALQTLKRGVVVALKEAIPSIVDLVDETDHSSGTNPFYT
jgi:Fe-S cluster biogenesis protein NfuA